MKILIVQDYEAWAINQLSEVIRDGNQHLEIEIMTIHPKEYRVAKESWNAIFKSKLADFNPDLVHFQYWDLANYLGKFVTCKKILTHHNQKNLLDGDWKDFDCLVVHTQKAAKILSEAGYKNIKVIQHGIDIEKFKFNENYDCKNITLGYVGRIVPWKGLYDIAKCAKAFKQSVICMGRIDKSDYWHKLQEFKDVLDLRFMTPPENQVEVYHEMGVYVGNSCDGIEEGTLGLLEAMACGIPVITTASGEAADIIKHGENGLIIDFENYSSLNSAYNDFMDMSDEQKNKMRQAAWDTVRNLNVVRMARSYEKVYYKTVFKNDLVSVIIPTYNRAETLLQVLEAYNIQDYKPIELIVVSDNSTDETTRTVLEFSRRTDLPVKLLDTLTEGYGLAKARNMGILEASGHYLIFNDDRLKPKSNAVSQFIEAIKGNKGLIAFFGEKGGGKKTFVENFFVVRKRDFVDSGMFNERINEYGGQSQEIRERLSHQGFDLIYYPKAEAKQVKGTHSRTKKRYELYRMKNLLWKLSN